MPRKNKKTTIASPEYQSFFAELKKKYRCTDETILEAIEVVGLVKARIETYFLVEDHLKKKSKSKE